MLPVYKADFFEMVIERGNRTKPWVVAVATESGQVSYVVKLFETREIEQRDSVANEVLGNVLAREFGLPVPDAALIDFDRDFIDGLPDPALHDILGVRDRRLKFGSTVMKDYMRFDPAMTSVEARRIIDIDTVFAFDNLIRNPDRNVAKPNILVRASQASLIDHELGFELDANSGNQFLQRQWPDRFYRFHIFRPHLERSTAKFKTSYFHEFEEYLKYLNVNDLIPYLEQLAACGYPTMKHGLILDYLHTVKKNSSTFVEMIRSFIA